MVLLRGHCCGLGVLQREANLLLANGIGHTCSSAEEVKVLADRGSFSATPAAEGVIVEFILLVVELVAQAIVGVLEINTGNTSVILSTHSAVLLESHASSSSSAVARATSAKGSGFSKKPLCAAGPALRSLGRLVSKPKKDMPSWRD